MLVYQSVVGSLRNLMVCLRERDFSSPKKHASFLSTHTQTHLKAGSQTKFFDTLQCSTWICMATMLGEGDPNIFSQMVAFSHGDELHGIPIRPKNHQLDKPKSFWAKVPNIYQIFCENFLSYETLNKSMLSNITENISLDYHFNIPLMLSPDHHQGEKGTFRGGNVDSPGCVLRLNLKSNYWLWLGLRVQPLADSHLKKTHPRKLNRTIVRLASWSIPNDRCCNFMGT